MTEYRVRLRGRGLRLVVDGHAGRYGFQVVRFVSAEDADAAARTALAAVRGDAKLVRSRTGFEVEIESIEINSGGIPDVQPGFLFIAEEPDESDGS